MLGDIVINSLVLFLGYAYPAFKCLKAIEKHREANEELIFWCQYWVIIAVLTVFERIGDIFISWLPMYIEMKLALIIYLWHPKTKGTGYVYNAMLRPFLAQQGTGIEISLWEMRARAWDAALYYWHNSSELGHATFFRIILFLASKPSKRRSKEHNEREKMPMDYRKMLLTATDPRNHLSERELMMLLLKGILHRGGKAWFSINVDGEHCEMISIAECLTSTASESPHYICSPEYTSRFAVGCYEPYRAEFKTHVRTQFLSPRITYSVNLVFKSTGSKSGYIGLRYKLKGEQSSSYSFLSDERQDGWLTAELYQFTSEKRTVDLEIWFYTEYCPRLLVEGIEFQPLKKVENEMPIDFEVDMQPISETETYWEQKLPSDYEEITKWSKDSLKWETKKDLYCILCKGFLVSYGEEWFYLAKDGRKCLMVPARAALEEDRWDWKSRPGTRFEEVADCISDTFAIFFKFSSQMLSSQTAYAIYLVYELPDDYQNVDQPPPVQVVDKDSDSKEVYNVFLRTPQTPVISWNGKDEKIFNPLSRPKIKGLPKRRSDGWMEVQVHEFQTRTTIKMISTRLKFSSYNISLEGVVVQGFDYRPV